MGSDERIQELDALKPRSLLRACVAGHGYSLWPEDLALVGNAQLVEASLLNTNSCAPKVTYTITRLNTNLRVMAFRLCWPQHPLLAEQADLHFCHAIVCNAPQSEASVLALGDLSLSLLRYYESNYTEIGAMLAQIAQTSTAPDAPSWSEKFFRLPQQLPTSLNSQMRAMLIEVRKAMPDVAAPVQARLVPQRNLQWLAILGWLVAGLLFLLRVAGY